MKTNKNIVVVGGDNRQKILFEELKHKKKNCSMLYTSLEYDSLEKVITSADVVILPLPVTKDGIRVYSQGVKTVSLEKITSLISPSTLVLGGMMPKSFTDILDEKKVKYYDYYRNESLLIYNASLTAQAAVKLTLEQTAGLVSESKVLVTGFGRIAKPLSIFLKSLGYRVYVAARNPVQRAEAESLGLNALKISELSFSFYLFDIIVNTVPSRIIKAENIMRMKDGACYIELASKPYGADEDDFANERKNYIRASSLPGKYYPAASSKLILNSISQYL